MAKRRRLLCPLEQGTRAVLQSPWVSCVQVGVDAISGSEVESERKKKRARTRPGSRAASRAIARNDELGKLIRAHTDYLLIHGWEALVRKVRGRGDLKV